LPQELKDLISNLTPKARKSRLWPVILWLCAIEPYFADKLAEKLDKQANWLKSSHLKQLKQELFLQHLYPEVKNHPNQAYVTTEEGKGWLEEQGYKI
jgi:ATP-dependent DNA helicase RecG